MKVILWIGIVGSWLSPSLFASSPFVAGLDFACLLHEKEAKVSCWDGLGKPLPTPIFKAPTQLTAGDSGVCVIDAGRVRCWAYAEGNSRDGEYAIALAEQRNRAFADMTHVTLFAQTDRLHDLGTVSLDPAVFACAYDTEKKLRCLGTKEIQENIPEGKTPLMLATTKDSIACAIWEDGTLSCWGALKHSGTFGEKLAPELASGIPGMGRARELVVVDTHPYWRACIVDGSQVRCWGNNGHTDFPAADPALAPHNLSVVNNQVFWLKGEEIQSDRKVPKPGEKNYVALEHAQYFSNGCLINGEEIACADGRRFYHGEDLPVSDLRYLEPFLRDVAGKIYVDKRALVEAAIESLGASDPQQALFAFFALEPLFTGLDSAFAAEVKPYYVEQRRSWEKRTGLAQLTDFPHSETVLLAALPLAHLSLAPLRGEKDWAELDEAIGRALASHASESEMKQVYLLSKRLAPHLQAFLTNPRTRTFALTLQQLLYYLR